MIYIATHKMVEIPELEGYVVLQDRAEGRKDYGYVRDNTGDTISEKNPNYSELTGLYWIWKNYHDKYKGLVHYKTESGLDKDIIFYGLSSKTNEL